MSAAQFLYACPPKDPKWRKILGRITPKEGSIDVPCSECKELCIVGPEQQDRMKTFPGEVICFPCAVLRGDVHQSEIIPCGKKGHTYGNL